jgi:hypothetical protein
VDFSLTTSYCKRLLIACSRSVVDDVLALTGQLSLLSAFQSSNYALIDGITIKEP